MSRSQMLTHSLARMNEREISAAASGGGRLPYKDSGCSRYQVSVGVSYTLQVLIGERKF